MAAAHTRVFNVKEGCFFPDVAGNPKLFFEECIKMNLDLWNEDNNQESIMSLLLSSGSFALAEGFVEVACKLRPSDLGELLAKICKDQAEHTLWKSSLVGKILACLTRRRYVDLNLALQSCCLNIKTLYEKGMLQFGEVSVHLDIANQLRLHGAIVKCCEDLCTNIPELHTFLTKAIDFNDAPLTIPWTSYSVKHKDKLERVARRQNVVSVNIYCHHDNPIGSGSFGDVFAGICGTDGREIAIKKIVKRNMKQPQDTREITNLTALADCNQVVKYIYFDDTDKDFAYIVLELMEGHLDDYLESSSFTSRKSISLCRDLVMGLKYLHNYKPAPILHRDLKPGNILYKVHPSLCLKIADFGLSSPLSTTGTTVLGTNAGTRCWIAPEVISSDNYKHSQESDNYSCRLLLHYILSPQKHPFSPVDCSGRSAEIIDHKTQANMLSITMESWDNTISPEATHLIKGLLSWKAKERPSSVDSLSHPLFWPNKKKLAFLCAVGNQPEIERPIPAYGPLPPFESDIETSFSRIVKYSTWNDARYNHMPGIYTEMSRPIIRGSAPPRNPRRYNTASAVELIRFIRNAKDHVSEASRPTAIRKQILEDVVFLEYFPNLVMEVYTNINKHGCASREEIKHAMSSENL